MTAPTLTPALQVKLASHSGRWCVVECKCGWSSALHESASAANNAYLQHKRDAAAGR